MFLPARFLAAAALVFSGLAVRAAETWPFEPKPDAFSSEALLDLRSLNEKQSGESGFVGLAKDGNSFIRGDGAPLRFWAVGSDGWNLQPEEMDRQCRWLAKMGVNLVRLHFVAAAKAPKEGEPALPITALNEKLVEGVRRYIKAAKDAGIYLILSPYWAHHEMPESWGIEGFKPKEQLWGALFIDEKLQDAYRHWTRELYTRPNPHTGLAIKDDPTVAFLQIQNEDSLFFWTEQKLPEPQKRKLGRAFRAWLAGKYGSLDAALAAWGEKARLKRDDFAAGVVAIEDIYHLTRPAPPAMAKRLRDQTEFMAHHQRAFYAAMGEHLRALGCRQLLNGSNWRTANDGTMKDLERYTYGALQWDAENRYILDRHKGEFSAWRVQAGNVFSPASALREPLALPTSARQQEGHPFMVTEILAPSPNPYQAEGAFLGAAYQSVGGVDALCWFATGEPGWNTDPRFPYWNLPGGKAQKKFLANAPLAAGMWPANALLYRRGYLREGPVVVRDVRPLGDLWERKAPLVSDHEYAGDPDELSRGRMEDGRVSRAAFFAGQVRWEATEGAGRTEVADLSGRIRDGVIAAVTGEVSLDPKKGLCRMMSARAQGVCGFLREAGGRFELPDATIESQNDYAAIQLVSLDGEPLATSRRVLAQCGTQAQLTGWETKPAEFEENGAKRQGEEVVATGAAPWRIVAARATLTLKNPHLSKATRLDPNGLAAGDIALSREGDALRFAFPPDALWVVLE